MCVCVCVCACVDFCVHASMLSFPLRTYCIDFWKPGLGLSGLTLYASNEDDPYITLKEAESSDEEDSYRIYPTDNLICIGKAEEEFGVVEVHGMSTHHTHTHTHTHTHMYSLYYCCSLQ